MAYQAKTWTNDVTELSAENFNPMEQGIAGAYPVQLIAISDTAPSECVEEDKYYNTSTKKIYTATGTNTWGTNGETPLEDTAYWLISENGSYAWNGTDLVSIGGGKAEVVISDEEPEDGKLWVDTAEIPVIAGRENLVQVSDEVDEDYRVNFLKSNNLFDKNNVNVLNASLNGQPVPSSNNAKTLWIKITGGKIYTISKVQSSRFRICTTEVQPALNTAIAQYTENDNATSMTITTNNNANFLLVYYYLNGTDTLTEQQILNSIMINEGDTALPYEPYITPSIYVDNEEIYSKRGWNYITKTTGTTVVDVPSEAEEIFAMVELNNSLYQRFPFNIPTACLSSTMIFFNEGYTNVSGGNTYTSFVRIGLSSTQMRLEESNRNGTTETNITNVYWYYK